jgi:hypothetical protein
MFLVKKLYSVMRCRLYETAVRLRARSAQIVLGYEYYHNFITYDLSTLNC